MVSAQATQHMVCIIICSLALLAKDLVDVPDVHSPSVPSIALAASEIRQNQVSKSGRMIKRRVAGTAAYDNVVSRQKAASRRYVNRSDSGRSRQY